MSTPPKTTSERLKAYRFEFSVRKLGRLYLASLAEQNRNVTKVNDSYQTGRVTDNHN